MPDLDEGFYEEDADLESIWASHPLNPSSSSYTPSSSIIHPGHVVDVAVEYANDLQKALDELPVTGGTILLDDHIYPQVVLKNKSNVHFIGKSKAGTILRGIFLYGYTATENYGAFSGNCRINNLTYLWMANNRLKNYYFYNLTFDGDGTTVGDMSPNQIPENPALFCRGVRNVLVDNCIAQNYIGHGYQAPFMANAIIDGFYVRDTLIDTLTNTAFYLDGGSGGLIGCEISANIGDKVSEHYLNADCTADFDQDTIYNWFDKRQARILICNNTCHGNYSSPAIDLLCGQVLVKDNTFTGSIGTLVRIWNVYFSHLYDDINPGVMTGQGYVSYHSVIKDNDIQGSVNYLLELDGTRCIPSPPSFEAHCGKYSVINNHVGTLNIDWVNEIPDIDGLNIVSGNTEG